MGLHELEQFGDRQPQLARQLFWARVAPELSLHLASGLDHLVARLDPMNRNANRMTRVDQAARDTLANPPRRISRKAKSQSVVKLFHGAHQT